MVIRLPVMSGVRGGAALLILLAGFGAAKAQNRAESYPPAYSTPNPTVAPGEQAAPGAVPSVPLPAHGPLPASLQTADQNAVRVYQLARSGRWQSTGAPLAALQNSIAQMPVNVVGSANYAVALDGALHSLDEAVTAKDRLGAMRSANDITRIVAEMSRQYQPAALADARMLDVYSRQLEVESARGDTAAMRQSVADMTQTWNNLRPQLEARGARAQISRIDGQMDRLQSAQTSRDYERLGIAMQGEASRAETMLGAQP